MSSPGALVVHWPPGGLLCVSLPPSMPIVGSQGQALRGSLCATFTCRKMTSSTQAGPCLSSLSFTLTGHSQGTFGCGDRLRRVWAMECCPSHTPRPPCPKEPGLPARSGDPSVVLEAVSHKERLMGSSRKPEAHACAPPAQPHSLADGPVALAKKGVQVFPYHLTEKPRRTFLGNPMLEE